MSVSKAVNKLCPVFFIEGFSNPALDGALWEHWQRGGVVLNDVFLGVEKRTSYWVDIVAACRQHLLRRAIGGARTIFPMKSICRAAIMLPMQGMS